MGPRHREHPAKTLPQVSNHGSRTPSCGDGGTALRFIGKFAAELEPSSGREPLLPFSHFNQRRDSLRQVLARFIAGIEVFCL